VGLSPSVPYPVRRIVSWCWEVMTFGWRPGPGHILQGWPRYLFFGGDWGMSQRHRKVRRRSVARIAWKRCAPEAIFIENQSTNTGEKSVSGQLWKKRTPSHSFLLVQKPYMERRSYATLKKHWRQRIDRHSPQMVGRLSHSRDPMERVIDIMSEILSLVSETPFRG